MLLCLIGTICIPHLCAFPFLSFRLFTQQAIQDAGWMQGKTVAGKGGGGKVLTSLEAAVATGQFLVVACQPRFFT